MSEQYLQRLCLYGELQKWLDELNHDVDTLWSGDPVYDFHKSMVERCVSELKDFLGYRYFVSLEYDCLAEEFFVRIKEVNAACLL